MPTLTTVYALCDDTLGVTAMRCIDVDRIVKLGCGCSRYCGNRPGPQTDPDHPDRVELLSGCQTHASCIAVIPTTMEARHG